MLCWFQINACLLKKYLFISSQEVLTSGHEITKTTRRTISNNKKPGGLQSTGSQNMGHNSMTEQQQSIQWAQRNRHQPNYRDSLGLHGQHNRLDTRSMCRSRFFSWVTGQSSVLYQAVENEYRQLLLLGRFSRVQLDATP